MTTQTLTALSAAIALVPVNRRSIRVAIWCPKDRAAGALGLAAQLRASGYREVVVTHDFIATATAQVVVCWEVKQSEVSAVASLQEVAPESYRLVYTLEGLQGVPRGPQWLLSNSPVRLLGDLSALADMLPRR